MVLKWGAGTWNVGPGFSVFGSFGVVARRQGGKVAGGVMGPLHRPLYALSPRAVAAARPRHCCAQSLPGRLRMTHKAAAQDDLPREEDGDLRSEGPEDSLHAFPPSQELRQELPPPYLRVWNVFARSQSFLFCS